MKLAAAASSSGDLKSLIPQEIGAIDDHQTALPRIARDPKLTAKIEAALRHVPTQC